MFVSHRCVCIRFDYVDTITHYTFEYNYGSAVHGL